MDSEGACALAEQRVADLKAKLREMEIQLAEGENFVSTRDKEVADLKEALKENKFYDIGFADAENSRELIMFEL